MFSPCVWFQFSCWLEWAWPLWRCVTWQPKCSRWRKGLTGKTNWPPKLWARCSRHRRSRSWKRWRPTVKNQIVWRASALLEHRHFDLVYGLGPDPGRLVVSCFMAKWFADRANSFARPKANRMPSFQRRSSTNVGEDGVVAGNCYSSTHWQPTRWLFLVPSLTLLVNQLYIY